MSVPHLLASIDDRIIAWVARGGYFVLFGLLFACGLGLPLPEDIPLLAAGILIQQGKFHWAIAGICAWLGIVGGDCVLYHLGKRFGADVTKIPFIGRHINKKRLQRVEQWFEQYGVWVVAVGRLFAGVRGAMVVVAGATRFNFVKFVIADGLAAIVSGGLFVCLGYVFAHNLDRMKELVHQIKGGMLIAAGVLGVAIVVILIVRGRRKRLEEVQGFPIEPASTVSSSSTQGVDP